LVFLITPITSQRKIFACKSAVSFQKYQSTRTPNQVFRADRDICGCVASKEWSGTRADFERKASKLEQAITHIMATHREFDRQQTDKDLASREKQYVD
jgi:hypothetical protein